jgi:hypothetical protein
VFCPDSLSLWERAGRGLEYRAAPATPLFPGPSPREKGDIKPNIWVTCSEFLSFCRFLEN